MCQRATSECRRWLFSRQLNSEAPLLSLSLPVSPQYGDAIDSTAATRVKKSVVWRSNPPGFSLSHTHTHGHRHTTTKTPQRRRKVNAQLEKAAVVAVAWRYVSRKRKAEALQRSKGSECRVGRRRVSKAVRWLPSLWLQALARVLALGLSCKRFARWGGRGGRGGKEQ